MENPRINKDKKRKKSYQQIKNIICKFFCLSPGPHIFRKYAQHKHLRCPIMGKVSL